MSKICAVVLLALMLVGTGCGYSSRNYMNGGALRVTGLMPNSAMHGGNAFNLVVNGTGFGTDSVVYFGTTPRTTTYTSTTQVMAEIPAADIANMGPVQVYVHTGGANSNAVTFTTQ